MQMMGEEGEGEMSAAVIRRAMTPMTATRRTTVPTSARTGLTRDASFCSCCSLGIATPPPMPISPTLTTDVAESEAHVCVSHAHELPARVTCTEAVTNPASHVEEKEDPRAEAARAAACQIAHVVARAASEGATDAAMEDMETKEGVSVALSIMTEAATPPEVSASVANGLQCATEEKEGVLARAHDGNYSETASVSRMSQERDRPDEIIPCASSSDLCEATDSPVGAVDAEEAVLTMVHIQADGDAAPRSTSAHPPRTAPSQSPVFVLLSSSNAADTAAAAPVLCTRALSPIKEDRVCNAAAAAATLSSREDAKPVVTPPSPSIPDVPVSAEIILEQDSSKGKGGAECGMSDAMPHELACFIASQNGVHPVTCPTSCNGSSADTTITTAAAAAAAQAQLAALLSVGEAMNAPMPNRRAATRTRRPQTVAPKRGAPASSSSSSPSSTAAAVPTRVGGSISNSSSNSSSGSGGIGGGAARGRGRRSSLPLPRLDEMTTLVRRPLPARTDLADRGAKPRVREETGLQENMHHTPNSNAHSPSLDHTIDHDNRVAEQNDANSHPSQAEEGTLTKSLTHGQPVYAHRRHIHPDDTTMHDPSAPTAVLRMRRRSETNKGGVSEICVTGAPARLRPAATRRVAVLGHGPRTLSVTTPAPSCGTTYDRRAAVTRLSVDENNNNHEDNDNSINVVNGRRAAPTQHTAAMVGPAMTTTGTAATTTVTAAPVLRYGVRQGGLPIGSVRRGGSGAAAASRPLAGTTTAMNGTPSSPSSSPASLHAMPRYGLSSGPAGYETPGGGAPMAQRMSAMAGVHGGRMRSVSPIQSADALIREVAAASASGLARLHSRQPFRY